MDNNNKMGNNNKINNNNKTTIRMNDADILTTFLIGMGLSRSEVGTLKIDTGSRCQNCKTRCTRNWATLVPCNHQVCYTCLDHLYDNYILTDTTTLFVCPFCHNNITDWIST